MYSTYQQYQQRGGKLPESEYQANAQKASELIDYYTMGQAASAETMGPQLSACECDLADIIPTLQGAASGIQRFLFRPDRSQRRRFVGYEASPLLPCQPAGVFRLVLCVR